MFNHLRYETKSDNPMAICNDIERWYLKLLKGSVIANNTSGENQCHHRLIGLEFYLKMKHSQKIKVYLFL